MEGNVNLNPNNYDNHFVDESYLNDRVKKSTFYSQVFLYFGLGLFVTALVTVGLSLWFTTLPYETTMMFYGVALVVSLILMIVLNFVMMSTLSREGGKSILVPYVVYAVMYGVLFGCIAGLLQDPVIIGVSLGITSLAFLGMCGIGYITHNKMSTMAKIISGLTIAVLLLCLVNLVILPFTLFGGKFANYFANGMVYWVMEGIFFFIFLAYTAYDFARIRNIADHGVNKHCTNLSLYCAFTIYTDFIAIFTYVLRFVLIAVANRDN